MKVAICLVVESPIDAFEMYNLMTCTEPINNGSEPDLSAVTSEEAGKMAEGLAWTFCVTLVDISLAPWSFPLPIEEAPPLERPSPRLAYRVLILDLKLLHFSDNLLTSCSWFASEIHSATSVGTIGIKGDPDFTARMKALSQSM